MVAKFQRIYRNHRGWFPDSKDAAKLAADARDSSPLKGNANMLSVSPDKDKKSS